MWETLPLLAHPPDLWCHEMSASSETDTVHVMNHQTSERTTEAETVRKKQYLLCLRWHIQTDESNVELEKASLGWVVMTQWIRHMPLV